MSDAPRNDEDGHGYRVTCFILAVQPLRNSSNEVRDGITSMGRGVRVCEPGNNAIRIAGMNFVERTATPCSIVTIAQFGRGFDSET